MRSGSIARVLGAITLLAVIAAPAAAQQQAAPVEVDAVRSEPLAQTFPVLGRLIARQSGTVAALTRGPVAEVLVDVGDRVSEGDVLARLALNRLEQSRAARAAELNERRAERRTATASLDLAREEMARLEKLKGSAAFSKARYDDKRREIAIAEAAIGEADAAISLASAELGLADIDLSLGIVKAPFAGVITRKYVERGAYVNVGDPAFALINDRDLEIEADVPSDRLAGLFPGRELEATLSGRQSLSATVRALVPQENALTRTRQVRFIPDIDAISVNEGPGLAAGQSVNVHVPVGEPRDVVTVHKDAVLPRGGNNQVFVVTDNTVTPRPISLGVATGDRFVVLEGLKPGELVVTRGNERLRPGQQVTWPGAKSAAGDGASSDG